MFDNLDRMILDKWEHEISLHYNNVEYHLEIVERDFTLDPWDVSTFDGMILTFSCDQKESFDELIIYFMRIQATNLELIPRIVVCNKIDLFDEILTISIESQGSLKEEDFPSDMSSPWDSEDMKQLSDDEEREIFDEMKWERWID